MDPSFFHKKKLFSFKRGNRKDRAAVNTKTLTQELEGFEDQNFNVQQYVADQYTQTTPDKAPEHVTKLQSLLGSANELLKTYVYKNHNAFVHASNRTASVENDIVFLKSLIHNLRLSVSTLSNETISIEPAGEQQGQVNQLALLGMAQDNTKFITVVDKGPEDESSLLGIGGFYNPENLIKIKMFKTAEKNDQNNNNLDDIDTSPLQMPSIQEKYAKYIQNTTTAKFKDEDGAVLGELNNITIPTNETINLVELSEDLQSLIFERRLAEAVNIVELLVILGVIPPIIQFDQKKIDKISTKKFSSIGNDDGDDDDLMFQKKKSEKDSSSSSLSISESISESINPKIHYTSLDFIDTGIINAKTPNPSHLRHRLQMSNAVLHENVVNLTNPPIHFKPQTTTTVGQITENLSNKNFFQRHLEETTLHLLASNDSQNLTQARVYDNTLELSQYNDGQYTFQPMLTLPQLPQRNLISQQSPSPTSAPPSGLSSPHLLSPKGSTVDHATLMALTPTPTAFSSIFGFGKQQPPPTWRLQHEVNTLKEQSMASSKKGRMEGSTKVTKNVIIVNQNKVEKNTNTTHHFTKQTKVSTHIGKLVTVLVSLLLDEVADFSGTSWEQNLRILLLCRLNQHHLALHRYLVIQSESIQEQLKKTRYKGDLRIFTLSICNIVYSGIQATIRDFKHYFCNPKNVQPPTSATTTTSTTTSTTKNGTNTSTATSITLSGPTNSYSYLRDDLLAHLSTWILLEIVRLGKMIDKQLLQQDDRFVSFPACVNAIYQSSLETEQLLGTTTCNILVQCLHPSIVRTINAIAARIDKESAENVFRDEWTPVPLNFTLVPISLQTPKSLLAKEAVEMIEANQVVMKWRADTDEVMAKYKAKVREAKKREKVLKKTGKNVIGGDEQGDDKDGGDDNVAVPVDILTGGFASKSKIDKKDENDSKNDIETSISKPSGDLQPPELPQLPPGIQNIIHDKIRLYISGFSLQIYKTLLQFAKQLLSVLLCPIWRVSQQSIETIAIDVLCQRVDKVTRSIASLIRKHLATLVSPLPPDYLDFLTSIGKSDTKVDDAVLLAQNFSKKQDAEKQTILTSFLPSAKPAVDPSIAKSSLAYKTAAVETDKERLSKLEQINNIAVSLQNTTQSKRSFRPLSEVQLAILLNSLSFIAHYVFPYISLFISVNLCKPIPELLNACFRQQKLSLAAFEHVTKKKAQFLLRGRWYVQQDLQYRETLDQQRQLIERLTREGNREELLRRQDEIIPLPQFKENQDNLNTLHLPFNGALFWCDGEELHRRYANLPDFPAAPSIHSISGHMFSFLCHIYRQWHSYVYVLTPHQAKYMLRLLIDEVFSGLLTTIGWDVIFPTRNMGLYMIADVKVTLYFAFALFGILEETKSKRDAITRRITRIYAKEYIAVYLREYKQQRLRERQQLEQPSSSGEKGSLVGGRVSQTDDKKDSKGSTESESSKTTNTTTTIDGKTTKTTTTTTTTSSSNANGGSNTTTSSTTIDALTKPLGLAQSGALLAASTSVRAMSMDDLSNEAFVNDRNSEIDLKPEYYKGVAKLLLEYCGKNFLQDVKDYNCQEVRK